MYIKLPVEGSSQDAEQLGRLSRGERQLRVDSAGEGTERAGERVCCVHGEVTRRWVCRWWFGRRDLVVQVAAGVFGGDVDDVWMSAAILYTIQVLAKAR